MMREEESKSREEGVRERLKSRTRPPRVEGRGSPAPRIQPASQVTASTSITVERLMPLKPKIRLSTSQLKAAKPDFKGLGEMTVIEGIKAATLKAIVRTPKEGGVKAELLRPKTPSIEIHVPKTSEPGGVGVRVRPPLEERLKVPIKTPEQLESAAIRIPIARPPSSIAKPASPVVPEPIEKKLIIDGAREFSKTIIEESPEVREEEVFVPPLFEELRRTTLIGRPVCIVLPKRAYDSFVKSVAIICREIYRIVKGGKPEPRWISEGLKDEIERYLKAEGMVFVVDDSECKLLPNFRKILSAAEFLEKVNKSMILDRVREFFSQGFGFIIFHISERWASQFANMLEKEVPNANIIKVPSPSWQPKVKAVLATVCWGFIEEEGQTFDEIFGRCEEKFFRELKEASEDVMLTHWIKEDESAGYEHEGMKVIVVECLAKELGAVSKDDVVRMLKERIIETEHEISGGGRADIYLDAPSVQRFVEIETFYGREDPIKRLDKDTLSKYIGRGIGRVDVVLLTGIQALLYAGRLIELANVYSKEHGLKVNFYLPNIRERRLVPLREVFRMLKDAIGPLKPVEELTEDDVKRLWSEFSQALREYRMDPHEYEGLFKVMLDKSKSYKDNLSYMLEEIKLLKDYRKEVKLD